MPASCTASCDARARTVAGRPSIVGRTWVTGSIPGKVTPIGPDQLKSATGKQADILMKAMGDWVTQRKAEPAGVDPAALTAFEGWMKERGALAGQTVSMGLTPVHTAWQ